MLTLIGQMMTGITWTFFDFYEEKVHQESKLTPQAEQSWFSHF